MRNFKFISFYFYFFQELGCDGVLGSKITQDKCGTCGGDDTNCKIINGTFYDSKESGKWRNLFIYKP